MYKVTCPKCYLPMVLDKDEVTIIRPEEEVYNKYCDPKHGISPVRLNGWSSPFKLKCYCSNCGQEIIKNIEEAMYNG